MRELERELERLRDDLSQLQYELDRLRDTVREKDRIIEVHVPACGMCAHYYAIAII